MKKPILAVILVILAILACRKATPCELDPAQCDTVTQTPTPLPSPSVTPEPTVRAANSPPAPGICEVSTGVPAGYLNLRTGPGIQYNPPIRVLNEGETLTVITRGAWNKVRDADGVTGYVNASYCR